MTNPVTIATIGGFEISLEEIPRSTKAPWYKVTYGQQTKTLYSYHDAAKEIGLCVLHALAANGDITLED